ncbi:MAG: LacI family DNA-binding transcriptional regulator [Lentisphaeria bacterium]|nr:LacI family DNA-binding transcriptional regulator [Lentisphaeria bacterium]
MVTGKDIAVETGYALSTVEKVLRGHAKKYKIKDNSSQKILDAARKMGYYKNEAAVITRTGVNRTIALFTATLEKMHAVYSKIISGVMAEAARNDYSVLMFSYWDDLEMQLRKLPGKRIKKLICLNDQKNEHNVLVKNFCKEHGIEVVFVSGGMACGDELTVATDDYNGVREAVKYLVQNGMKKIALITGDYYPERQRGAIDALAEAGLQNNEKFHIIHTRSMPYSLLQEKIGSMLDEEDIPDSFWCLTDDIAMMVMMQAHRRNLRVPEDLSIIGYGNAYPIIQYAVAPLTTVEQPFQTEGETAVKLLLGLETENAVRKDNIVYVKVNLIERESVKKK